MSKIVPLISSGTKGPLGVLHLPRLWQKVSLEAAGKLADDYDAIGDGYDTMVINALGLEAEAVKSYITNEKPTYTQFETWIQAQDGATLGEDAISKINSDIAGYNHVADTKAGILGACDLESGPDDAVNLNNLEDWQEFHAAEIAG